MAAVSFDAAFEPLCNLFRSRQVRVITDKSRHNAQRIQVLRIGIEMRS